MTFNAKHMNSKLNYQDNIFKGNITTDTISFDFIADSQLG